LTNREQSQALDILEVFSITGEQWQIVRHSDTGDEAVRHSDRSPAPCQSLADDSGDTRRLTIKRQYWNCSYQATDSVSAFVVPRSA